MFESIGSFFKKIMKPEQKELLVEATSKDAAKERLHIVLMQDRANVSADFLELMKQEIIDVIKKYIVVDEKQIDVRLTNQENDDGTTGAPALYANIPILNIRNDIKGEVLNGNDVPKIVEQVKVENYVADIAKKQKDEVNENVKSFEISKENNQQEINNLVNSVVSDNYESIEKPEIVKEVEELDVSEISDDSNIEENIYDDEMDDDVTFDDLLKVAEEEEKKKNNEDLKNSSPKKKSASVGRPKKKSSSAKGKKSASKKKK